MPNILMNADAMYPRGFHPVVQRMTRDFKHFAQPYSRATAPEPVDYWIADFGLSVHIPPGEPRLVLGDIGADREVPELSDTKPYDPFKVDIFVLGNVIRGEIYKVCCALLLVTLYSLINHTPRRNTSESNS